MSVKDLTDKKVDPANRVLVQTWEGLAAGDTGYPVALGRYPDLSAHIWYEGAGSGSTIVLQGSNDGRANPAHPNHSDAKWLTLKDSDGNAISTTVDLLVQKLANAWWMRPTVTDGTGTIYISLHMTRAVA